MAPEIQVEELQFASQEDLEKADIWSLGLVMYSLINPNIPNPCRGEFEEAGIPFSVSAMKKVLSRKQLPRQDRKYEYLRKSQSCQFEDVFNSYVRFNARSRPTAAEALRLLDNSQPLHDSKQSQQKDKELAVNGKS